MKMDFCAMDMKTWPRSYTYKYFTETVSPLIYSVNVTLDVTKLRGILKKQRLKFFPAYLYLITKGMISQKEFLMARQDDILGYWNFRTPLYPIFHEDDQTITFLWTEYDNDFKTFYKNYTSDIINHGKQHGVMMAKGEPPANSYIIACTPWFSFNSVSMHLQNAKNYYAPMFEAGGFQEAHGTIKMPLSITVNHAVIDGYHIKVFLENLQSLLEQPEKWI